MNKTLSINIHQDPTPHLEVFLHSWLQFGAYEQLSELKYELIGSTGKVSVMSITETLISIYGDIPSESFMLIDKLAKACEGDKVIEGEVIDKDQPQPNPFAANSFGNAGNFEIPAGMNHLIKISSLSKTKLILLLILALPLLIISIPIIIVVMIIKIIKFKLKGF